MQKTVRIGVVGAGYWGKNLTRNFASLESLAVICDLDEKNLAYSKKKYPGVKTTNSFLDILSDNSLDAVVISTPAEMHYQMAKDSLLADKHVFVEKPLALNVDQGEELLGLSSDRKRIHYNVVLSKSGDFSQGNTEKTVTLNVSKSGCFIYTTGNWRINDRAAFTFKELDDNKPILATVKWKTVWGKSMQIPGIGVEFKEIGETQIKKIRSKWNII